MRWWWPRGKLLAASKSNRTTVYGERATVGLRVFRIYVNRTFHDRNVTLIACLYYFSYKNENVFLLFFFLYSGTLTMGPPYVFFFFFRSMVFLLFALCCQKLAATLKNKYVFNFMLFPFISMEKVELHMVSVLTMMMKQIQLVRQVPNHIF